MKTEMAFQFYLVTIRWSALGLASGPVGATKRDWRRGVGRQRRTTCTLRVPSAANIEHVAIVLASCGLSNVSDMPASVHVSDKSGGNACVLIEPHG